MLYKLSVDSMAGDIVVSRPSRFPINVNLRGYGKTYGATMYSGSQGTKRKYLDLSVSRGTGNQEKGNKIFVYVKSKVLICRSFNTCDTRLGKQTTLNFLGPIYECTYSYCLFFSTLNWNSGLIKTLWLRTSWKKVSVFEVFPSSFRTESLGPYIVDYKLLFDHIRPRGLQGCLLSPTVSNPSRHRPLSRLSLKKKTD